MNNALNDILLRLQGITDDDLVLIVIGFLIGALIIYLIMSRSITRLTKQIVAYETRFSVEKELEQKVKDNQDDLVQHFRDSFSALSGKALKDNNEEFLKLARENFSKQHATSEHLLSEKEKALLEESTEGN